MNTPELEPHQMPKAIVNWLFTEFLNEGDLSMADQLVSPNFTGPAGKGPDGFKATFFNKLARYRFSGGVEGKMIMKLNHLNLTVTDPARQDQTRLIAQSPNVDRPLAGSPLMMGKSAFLLSQLSSACSLIVFSFVFGILANA